MRADRHWSSAIWLALACVALVLYASLYPFEGWRWPPGQDLPVLLRLPRTRYPTAFDTWINLLGYWPAGLLLALAALRSGVRAWAAMLMALLLASGLSYLCEVLQHFMPRRVPSIEDWWVNSLGALLGALSAGLLQWLGAVERWQAFRSRWFTGDAALALLLLYMWPVALLFPSPVPMGLGLGGDRVRASLSATLQDIPALWALDLKAALAATPAAVASASQLEPLATSLIVAMGLLAPCLVAYSVVAPGWRRLSMLLATTVVGMTGVSLSTLLNFGPQHMWSWAAPVVTSGLAAGLAMALLALPLSRSLSAVLGLMVLTVLVVGVAHAPEDPYFAQSLLGWEQGRFVRFHGLSQWVGWLWPFAAMLWMFIRVARFGRRH